MVIVHILGMFVTEVPHKCVSTGSASKLCQLLGMFWQIVRSLAELRTFVFVFSTASSGAIPQWQHKWLSDSIKIGYPRLLQWPWTYLLMPRPSARTKYFLSWTKLKLSKTKFLSRVKNYIFCFQKSCKMSICCWI